MNSIPCEMKNRSLYWTVKSRLIYSFGKEPNITELKKLADEIHTEHNLQISRNTKRSKELIICWLCDNWLVAENHLRQIPNEYLCDPNNVIISSKCSKEKKQKLMKEYLLRDKMIETENILKKIFNCTKLKMVELLRISEKICSITKLKLDRNEKRDKMANLAWFTNNWDEIKPLITDTNFFNGRKEETEMVIQKEIFDNENNFLIQENNLAEDDFDEYFLQDFMVF